MFSAPSFGPSMLKHNETIVELNSYWYFKNRKTMEINAADSGAGPYIIAYTDKTLSDEAYNNIFSKEYDIIKIDESDMVDFFRTVSSQSGVRDKYAGVVLNLPADFITGKDELIFEGELPLHLFYSEELINTNS